MMPLLVHLTANEESTNKLPFHDRFHGIGRLVVPAALIEPLKLAAVAIAGEGHWITGGIVIVCAYAASLFVVERLFRIVNLSC